MKQGVEFGHLAELQWQLVEESESLRSSRIDRLAGLEHRCSGVNHGADVETLVRGRDDRPVIKVEAAVQPDLGDRDLHRDRGVADADRLAGFKQQLASAFDLLAG